VIFALEMTRNLESAFNRIDQTNLENVTKIVKSMVSIKKTEIHNILKIIGSDNDLASAYLLSQETKDNSQIFRKLEQIKQKSNFDFIDVISMKGKSLTGLLDKTLDFSHTENRDDIGFHYTTVNGNPALVAVTSLKYYKDPIAKFSVGYLLNGNFSSEISHTADVSVSFSVSDPRSESDLDDGKSLILSRDDNVLTLAKISINNGALKDIRNATNQKLLITGVLALVFLIILLYLLLKKVFLNDFQKLVEHVDYTEQELDAGIIPERKISKIGLIFEIKILSKSFEKLLNSLKKYSNKIKAQSQIQAELDKQAALSQQASAFAHDVRSPVMAIMGYVKALKNELPPEAYNAIQNSAEQITTMANKQLKQSVSGSNPKNESQTKLISELIKSAVFEKNNEYENKVKILVEVSEDAHMAYVKIDENDFRRVFSNILNNAYEAMEKAGTIKIDLKANFNDIKVVVTDSGKGIAKELLPKLFQRGATFGKKNGNGLGLYNSRNIIENWKGTLSLNSEQGKGTNVTICLPMAAAPEGFVTALSIRHNDRLVFVDDDEVFHDIWKEKIESKFSQGLDTHHFYSPKTFIEWASKNRSPEKRTFYFMDYDLKDKKYNGLELINLLDINKESTLVSFYFNQDKLSEIVKEHRITVLHKSLLEFVPITFDPVIDGSILRG
jgi:signal transduction histidine kinase